MFRQLISKLIGRRARTADPQPADPRFWIRLGHSAARADEIAACFPEYWEKRGASHAQQKARYCLARQLGEVPIDCRHPTNPKYADPEKLPATDPIAWCRVHGNEVFTLAEATKIAVIAARKRPESQLKPFRTKYQEVRYLPYQTRNRRFSFSDTRKPLNPLFWRQLGHNPAHARRLARCCPEYWFYRKKCSWKRALLRAIGCLTRFAAQLRSGQHEFYVLAETSDYEITKRDPIYWFSEGYDWDEALQKAILQASYSLISPQNRFFRLRALLHKAGRQAQLVRDGAIHVGGPVLGYQKEYDQIQRLRAKKNLPNGTSLQNWPRWGPLQLDTRRAAQSHYCAVGPAEGGTETLLRILMQSVPTNAWLVVDGRNDLFPAVNAIRPAEQIFLLNPLDARSSAWDIAHDAATPQQAQTVVVALLPAEPHHDPLLLESARALLAAIIQAFNEKAPGNWNLLHLVAAVERRNLKAVLNISSATAMAYKTLSANPHRHLVAAFVQSRLQPLKPAAAAWRHASRKISIAAWLQSPSVLMIASSIRNQHVLAPLNRVLFQLLVGNLLEPATVAPPNTWVFLSDLCQIGRLEPLSTLLSRGAAAGVTVALTLEDVEMLQRHYPTDSTGILGLCGNYALLKIANPITARWASQLLGMEKVQILYETEGTLSGKTSQGLTVTNAERPLVAPTEFQELPLPEQDRNLIGYFKTADGKTYKGTIDLAAFRKKHWLSEPASHIPAFEPCPEECCRFPDDTRAMLTQLGFPCEKSQRRRDEQRRQFQEPLDRWYTETATPTGSDEREFDPADFPRLEISPEQD